MVRTSTPPSFIPDDLGRLPEIIAADLAPDAGSTVYSATTRDGRTVVEQTLLWRCEKGGVAELLADAEDSQDAPSFSPDGTRIAYLQTGSGRAQVCVLELADRSTRTLTDFPRGVGAVTPRWSPDGSKVAFAACDAPARDKARPYRVTRPLWRRDGMGLIDDVMTDVWTVDVDGGEPTRLTFHDGMVLNVEWSPSGDRLLYTTFAEPHTPAFTVRTVDAKGSAPHVVMSGDYLVYAPVAAWLPDGRIVRTTPWDVYRRLDLVVHDPTTGEDAPLGLTLDGQIFGILQSGMNSAMFESRIVAGPSGTDVYLQVQNGGRVDIYRVSIPGATAEPVRTGDFSSAPLVVRGQQMLVAHSSMADPAGLVVVDLATGTEKPVPTLDRDWLTPEPFTVHELRFAGKDGTPVEGWFLEPRAGTAPYPTVLSIHGGPFAGYGHIFSADHHVLTAAGYGVVIVNYRGSSGYGEAFAQCLIGDLGHHDMGDLMSGIDHVISHGLADAGRLGSYGLSGGGYLTSWLLTHTDRFRAGVAECPVTDWNGMIGSDIPHLVSRWTNVPPGHGPEGMAEYARVSPATFAADCSTPMLIIEHEEDLRCPAGQGDVMYNALTMAGTTCEMLRLPGTSHSGIYDRKNLPARVERLAAVTDWFNRFIPPKA